MKKLVLGFCSAAIITASALAATGCNTDKIYVDTNAYFAPFEYLDGTEIKGVDIDIMNLVGEKLDKKVVFENTDFDVIVDNVSSGKKYDCGAAGITITEKRKALVDFSTPYYTSVQYVIYKGDTLSVDGTSTDGKNLEYVLWSSLANLKLGVQTNTTGDIYANDEIDNGALKNTGATCNGYQDAIVATDAIGTQLDAVIVDELPAKYIVKGNSALKCYPLYYDAATATEEQYAICVTKGNSELLNAINEVLAELGEEGINNLVAKHLGIDK